MLIDCSRNWCCIWFSYLKHDDFVSENKDKVTGKTDIFPQDSVCFG